MLANNLPHCWYSTSHNVYAYSIVGCWHADWADGYASTPAPPQHPKPGEKRKGSGQHPSGQEATLRVWCVLALGWLGLVPVCLAGPALCHMPATWPTQQCPHWPTYTVPYFPTYRAGTCIAFWLWVSIMNIIYSNDGKVYMHTAQSAWSAKVVFYTGKTPAIVSKLIL